MNALKSPEPTKFVSGNVAQNWSTWEQQFLTYFVACELGKKAKETQVAILLHTEALGRKKYILQKSPEPSGMIGTSIKHNSNFRRHTWSVWCK